MRYYCCDGPYIDCQQQQQLLLQQGEEDDASGLQAELLTVLLSANKVQISKGFYRSTSV